MYKDGFHIYYPYLPLQEKDRYYVIDHLITLMEEDEFLGGIPYKNNEARTIFDTTIIKSNGILMIGSKKPGGHPYKLTHIYDNELNEQDIEDYEEEELIYTLSNQRYDSEAAVSVIDDDDIKEKIEKVASQYDGGNKKKTKKLDRDNDSVDDNRNNNHNNHKQQSKHNSNDDDDNVSDDSKRKPTKADISKKRDIALARELTKIFNKKRAHEYKSWMRVGFALHAIDDSLFPDFVQFSKKDMAKYNEGKVTCEQIWNAAKNYDKFYSIVTIRHWARLDNSNQYYNILRKMNDSLFGKAETSKHVDIAEVIHELYKDRFVCIDITKKKWYEFQDHRWVFVQSAYTLEELISSEIRKMMTMYCSDKLREAADNEQGFDHDSEYKKYTKLMKMIDNLGDVKFRENVVRACANKFFDSEFQKKLDANVYLVGFLNGVYDLKEMCFRDGLPSDYVSKTVGYEWKEFNEKDPIFKKINKFFSQVQTEEDMREYLFTFIAKILRGEPDSKLHVWNGGGGNGKSTVIEIIKNLIGEDYFGIVPISLLTRKRGSSSSATPELADKYGKRLVVVQEPEHNDTVYVGQMKEYTGKDTIQARPLYGDPFYYKPQFTMVLTCNNLPYIPATDNGTWRRLRVVPFESEFVDENPTGERQFAKDEELAEEFPEWRQPLMWLIITKYYPIYFNGVNGKKYKIGCLHGIPRRESYQN
jgi:P4 family phage/plasmid primase-like protien